MRAAMTRSGLGSSDEIDEIDSPTEALDGFLSITQQSDPSSTEIWRKSIDMFYEHFQPLPDNGLGFTRIQIISARVMPPDNDNEHLTIKKYVVYDICIRYDRINLMDKTALTIERRYTDFLKLYEGLKAANRQLLADIRFPRKAFLGNFSSELVCERSIAFQWFLRHIERVPELRQSTHFIEFLRDKELNQACRLLDERRNEIAVPLLINCFRLLNKFFTDRSKCVLMLLLRLVAACTTSPVPHASAEEWAELALIRFEGVCDSDLLPLYIPLLKTCLQLWWQRGRDNKIIQDRLKSLELKGISMNNDKTLTQAIHELDPRTETV